MADLEDSEQWRYLADGNAKQARKRVAADVIIRDVPGRVLLVDPNYKEYWDLPGGMTEANESPRLAAAREIEEELGLKIEIGELLLVDWVGPHGPWDDQLIFVFDAGILPPARVKDLAVADAELNRFAFIEPVRAGDMLRADMASRLQRALCALRDGSTSYGEFSADQRRP